ncbi:MAG: glycerol-3-phosphate dehydrogenase/oxidase [Planctomycetes bacterium]|nr:glycerol-3-phosphate dehydrogenase/oxidase [Planctomycetota bacterium]
MRTDSRTLHGQTFDLIVVGAGIQGAAVARDAAERGLRVVLLDARDVGAGTSSRSSRLVHGGLRYLRQGHLSLVREALAERERLLRTVPHLVRPVPMLMPFFADGDLAPWRMRVGTWLYAALAGRSTLPRPRALDAGAAAAAFPGLRREGLRSAIEFFDAATQDCRLTLANVQAAAAAGAHVLTHCEAAGGGGDGLHVVDRFTRAEVLLRARHVVNATGPRADHLRRRLAVDAPPLVRQSRGSHLVLAPRSGETALAAFLPDGRIQFVIPHQDGTLCGTTDVDDPLDGDEGPPPPSDVDYLLLALRWLLEPAPARADVRFAYAGWRSLPAREGPPGALNREAFVVAEDTAMGTLHTIVGGKLTTHRSLAERTVARIFARREPSPTRTRPLPGGDGPREVTDPLWWRHGSAAVVVRAIAAEAPAFAQPLCPHRPFLAAELVHALRHEGAVTLADALLRRLVHSQGPCLQPACLRQAHALFLRARQWPVDDDATAAIAAVRSEVAALAGDLVADVTPAPR